MKQYIVKSSHRCQRCCPPISSLLTNMALLQIDHSTIPSLHSKAAIVTGLSLPSQPAKTSLSQNRRWLLRHRLGHSPAPLPAWRPRHHPRHLPPPHNLRLPPPSTYLHPLRRLQLESHQSSLPASWPYRLRFRQRSCPRAQVVSQ